MAERFSDQELHNLFQEHLPPVELPPHLAEQVRMRVLDEVALTYGRADSQIAAPAPTYAARPSAQATATRGSLFGSLSERFSWWRFATGIALTGATAAVLLFFVLTLPTLLSPEMPTGSTTGAAVLPPIEVAIGEPQVASVAVTDGRATVFRHESNSLETLASGATAELAQRDELMTLNGTAEVQLFDNQRMVIEPASRVSVDMLTLDDGNSTALVTVQYGGVNFLVDGPLDELDRFEVVTAEARIQSLGADFSVRPTLTNETFIETTSGSVMVVANGQVAQLNDGQSLTVTPDSDALVVMNAGEVALDGVADDAANPEADAVDAVAQVGADDPTPTPVPTYTPVETEAPAVAVVEVAPTETATTEATTVPTVAATATPLPTATDVPTAEPTAEPTLEPTATPTQPPPPTATPTATPTETAVPEPRTVTLVVPNPGVSGADRVPFDWTSSATLQPNEAYELIFWKEGQDPLTQGFGLAMPTRNTEVTVDLTDLDNRLGGLLDPGDYLWGIRIVTTEPEYSVVEFTGESRPFRYSGPQSSSSVGAPITGE